MEEKETKNLSKIKKSTLLTKNASKTNGETLLTVFLHKKIILSAAKVIKIFRRCTV